MQSIASAIGMHIPSAIPHALRNQADVPASYVE
jgi:hypothetical protein